MSNKAWRCLALVVVGLALGSARAQDGPPNVVVIITDDQGAGDLGSAGNPVVETPALDRLARESASFSRFYVHPVCTPTRSSLMTGRYSARTQAVDTYRGRSMMSPDEVTIAEVLSGAGYATGLFGKWHLGDTYPMRPEDQGFDRTLYHRGGGLGQPADAIGNNRRYTDAILYRNGVETQTSGYCVDVYTDGAIEFMRESVEAGRPFFVYLASNTPHSPFHDVPEDLYEKYKAMDLSAVLPDDRRADTLARVFAMVENIDQNVGRLLDTIDELGETDNTVVIYLHDNGPNFERYVGEMRGTKSMIHEGGIRSPCFVRWPGRVPAGEVREEIAAHYDLLPTIAELAGASVPEGVELDGRSLRPLLEGGEVFWPHRHLHIQAHRGDARIREHHFAVIGPRYKLIRPTGFHTETFDPEIGYELYDLVADPFERENLVETEPGVLAEMLADHHAWYADVSASPGWGEPPRAIIGGEAGPRWEFNRNEWRPTTGGGYGAQGEWWIEVAEASAFSIELWFRRPIESPTVEVGAGEVSVTTGATGMVQTVTVDRLELEEGPTELWVRVRGDEVLPPDLMVVTEIE